MKNTTTTPKANLIKITDALNPAFDALKARCLKGLNAQVESVIKKMEAHNWDLCAAYPINYSSRYTHEEVRAARFAFGVALGLTTRDTDKDKYGHLSAIPGNPNWRVMRSRKEIDAECDKKAADYARTFIEEYAGKLTAKVAKEDKTFVIDTVEYTGTADPFSKSLLTVTGTNGQMKWSTKCIINFSKYGKMFNQWPTRKVK